MDGTDDPETLEAARRLTPEQIHRGLFPETMDDLQYRSRAFAPIVQARAEFERTRTKQAKKDKT